MLREMVHESLRNAVENGYDLTTWSVDQIVDDLLTCDGELETYAPEDIRPFVEEWLNTQD